MTLSFDPDTLGPAASHFIGSARADAHGMALYRPSDGVALAGAPAPTCLRASTPRRWC